MRVKTSELTGAALDWAVTRCFDPEIGLEHFMGMHGNYQYDSGTFEYSTDWALGGFVIQSEKIAVAPFYREWVASKDVSEMIHDRDGDIMTVVMWGSELHVFGPTPLIAAMRCLICSTIGDEVEIPEKLCPQLKT